MTFDDFMGLLIFTFLFVYFILVTFPAIIKLFPAQRSKGLSIDFRNND